MGRREEPWDAETIIREAECVHHSDWLFPKPCEAHEEGT